MLAHISDATGFVITFCTVESVLNIEFLEQLVHSCHVNTYGGTRGGREVTLFAGKSYPSVHNLNVTLQSILITTLEITIWTVKLSFLVHSNYMSDKFPRFKILIITFFALKLTNCISHKFFVLVFSTDDPAPRIPY